MQAKKDRFSNIRESIKLTGAVSKNSEKVEAKEKKTRFRRQSLQLAQDSFESERLLRRFSNEDEEQQKNMLNSFDEKYRLLDKIGEGGNAAVHKCQYIDSGKIYAVKKVKMDEEHYLQLKKNFLSIKMLRHPTIIRYHALYFDISKHVAYLVMEYFPCENLLDLNIKDENELRIIFTQIFNAISYLHERNVCHRDIKPENILYDPMMKKIKIIDFGISKKTFQRGQRRDMLTIIGTYFYLAPQIFTGGGYDQKVDLWSIGVTLYKLVTGVTPFESQYHAQTIQNIIKGQPQLDSQIWNNYSFFIKDLIIRLLKSKNDRLSAKEALKHLWITQDSPKKARRASQKLQEIKFPRHDSENLSVFRLIAEEQSINIKHATSKEESDHKPCQQESPSRLVIKAKRVPGMRKNQNFELSDDEDTSPSSTKDNKTP